MIHFRPFQSPVQCSNYTSVLLTGVFAADVGLVADGTNPAPTIAVALVGVVQVDLETPHRAAEPVIVVKLYVQKKLQWQQTPKRSGVGVIPNTRSGHTEETVNRLRMYSTGTTVERLPQLCTLLQKSPPNPLSEIALRSTVRLLRRPLERLAMP